MIQRSKSSCLNINWKLQIWITVNLINSDLIHLIQKVWTNISLLTKFIYLAHILWPLWHIHYMCLSLSRFCRRGWSFPSFLLNKSWSFFNWWIYFSMCSFTLFNRSSCIGFRFGINRSWNFGSLPVPSSLHVFFDFGYSFFDCFSLLFSLIIISFHLSHCWYWWRYHFHSFLKSFFWRSFILIFSLFFRWIGYVLLIVIQFQFFFWDVSWFCYHFRFFIYRSFLCILRIYWWSHFHHFFSYRFSLCNR